MEFCKFLLTLASLTVALLTVVWSKPDEFSAAEQNALKQFRPLVKNSLKKDYEKLDIYLIHWLRARDLNVQEAKAMFQENLAWRKENKVDGILEEKYWPEVFHKMYPTDFGVAKDKKGRPALQAAFASWDVRKGKLAGHDFARNFAYNYERMTAMAYKLGKTEWDFLVDMAGYNLRQHACIACVSFYVDLVNIYEKYFPNSAAVIYLVNTPRTFEAILQIITRLMSPDTRKKLKVFGVDKSEWQAQVLNQFDANQLTSNYGGTKRTST